MKKPIAGMSLLTSDAPPDEGLAAAASQYRYAATGRGRLYHDTSAPLSPKQYNDNLLHHGIIDWRTAT